MLWPNMVWHNVEQYFHPLLIPAAHYLLIPPQSSQGGLTGVQIHSAVAVIILGRAILENWSKPQRRDAQIFQIIQVLANPPQIPAVIRAWLRSVMRSTGRLCGFVI